MAHVPASSGQYLERNGKAFPRPQRERSLLQTALVRLALLCSGHRAGPAFFECSPRLSVRSALFVCALVLSHSRVSAQPASRAGKPPEKSEKTRPAPVLTEDNEVKLGRENAEENDKHVKLVADAAMVERVNRIGQELAQIANATPIPATWGSSQLKQFKYSFKIVDDKDVNAYSLPGGYIYVNRGLLEYVHSDDELAGVLAHEIAHAAHHHMVKLLHEQNRLDRLLLPLKLLAIGALIVGKANPEDAQNVWLGTQLYSIARLNSYGVEAEKDADHAGLLLMTHSHYNPTGLYSFMLRLAADERSHTRADLGIFRTHPPGPERVEAAKKLLEAENIPIRLSDVDPRRKATVTLIKDSVTGQELGEIRIHDILLCRIAAGDGLSAEKHAQRVATRLTAFLDTKLQPFEIRLNRDSTRILVRGVALVTDVDAAAQNRALDAIAREMSEAASLLNQKRQLEGNL